MALAYVDHLWDNHGDDFTTGFPIMSSWRSFIVLQVILHATIYFIAPYFAYQLRSVDFKPLMLVINGYMLGVIGMGFFIGLVLTRGGYDGIACPEIDNLYNSSDIRILGIKLIAFMYWLMKVKEFQRPILASLAGKKNSRYLNASYTLFLSGQLTMAYLGSVFYPGGIFAFWPLIDAVFTICEYSYLVMRTASKELRPNITWGRMVAMGRLFQALALFVHGSYFLACETCGVRVLIKIQVVYNAIIIAYSIWAYFTSSSGKSLSASHAKLIVHEKNGYRNGIKNGYANGVRVKAHGDQNNNPKRG